MDPLSLTVGPPDLSDMGEPFYANVAHVSSTPYDFRLTFSLLSGVLSEAPRAVAEVIIPAAAVESLVDLLRAEMERFTDEFGPPRPVLQQSSNRA